MTRRSSLGNGGRIEIGSTDKYVKLSMKLTQGFGTLKRTMKMDFLIGLIKYCWV